MARYPEGSVMRSVRFSKEVYDWIIERSKKNYRDLTLETYVILQEAYELETGKKAKPAPKKNVDEKPKLELKSPQQKPKLTMKEVMARHIKKEEDK